MAVAYSSTQTPAAPPADPNAAVPPALQAQAPAASPLPTGGNLFGTAASTGNFTATGAAGTGVAAAPEVPPGASESAYQYANQVAGLPVTVGPEIEAILGSNPTTADAFIKAVLDLPTFEQANVEDLLWQAGLYTDPSGNLIAQPVFGSYDAGNFAALANAAIAAHDRGTSISDVIAKNTGSGVLQAPGPVLGGGKTYQVQTPDARSVYSATTDAAKNLLGRLPTAAEYRMVLAATNAAFTQYYTAQNAQTEQMSQAQYQQQLTSRTAKLQPVMATGALPSTQPKDAASYATTLLSVLGYPETASNIAFIAAWVQANGGMGDGTNPLKVTVGAQTQVAGQAGGQFANWQQGLMATVRELQDFPNLLAALMKGDASNELANSTAGPLVSQDLSKWSSGNVTSLKTAPQMKAAQAAAAATTPAQTAAAQRSGVDFTNPPSTQMLPVGYVPPGQEYSSGGQAMNRGLTREEAPNYMGPLPSGNQPPVPNLPAGVDYTRAQDPNFMGPLPATTLPPAPGGGAGGIGTVGTGLTQPTTPIADIFPGQQVQGPADSYLQPTTINLTTPPSPSDVADYQFMTEQGGIPYYANNWVQVMATVRDMINSTAAQEHV